MDDDATGWLGIIIVGLVAIWVWDPWLEFSDKGTIYWAKCDQLSSSGWSCDTDYETGNIMEFRVQPEQAEVVTWLLDQGSEKIQRYENCAIRDAENWRCPPQNGRGSLFVTDGKVKSNFRETIVLPQIYRWQWHLLDYGQFGDKFLDWSKNEFIGDWFGFPSTYIVFNEMRKELKRRKELKNTQ